MNNFFFYGTLLHKNVRDNIIGPVEGDLEGCILYGYVRVSYPGATFPILFKSPGDLVHGGLIRDVGMGGLERLDRYESRGHLYDRIECQLETRNGPTKAWAYVAPEHLQQDYNETGPSGFKPWELQA